MSRLVSLFAGLLAATALPSLVGAPSAGAQDAEGESSPVEAGEPIAADTVVIADGHVDVGPRFVGGSFTLLVRDDTVDPSVWRRLPDVVLHATDTATVQVPDDPTFSFLGPPGAPAWLFPQVQQPGIVWPGWNTQDPEVATSLQREVTWTLTGVEGPGAFVLFVTQDFGQPATIFDSRQPAPQRTGIGLNTHAHANWAFTAPGIYRLDMEMTATTLTGDEVTTAGSLQIAVGDATNPQDAFTTATTPTPSAPAADDAAPTDASSAPSDRDTADPRGDDRSSAVWLGLGAAGLLVLAAGGVVVRRGRRRDTGET